ncbi:MAG: SAM-dependent methyltransferase [bacterium]
MWDERYSTDEYVYGKNPNDFLVLASSRIPKGRVLCLAEGEGRNAVFLARKGFEVVAVDSSSVGLEKAIRLADERGVSIQTIHADLADFEIDKECFSGIISIFAHTPSDVRIDLHRKIVEGLAPGGVLVLEAFRPAQLNYTTGGPPSSELMMTLEDLKQELLGLNFAYGEEIEREIVEGNLHTGLCAVVQVVGVRP